MNLMNTKQVAEYLKLSTRTIFRMIENEAIPYKRAGWKYMFSKDEIDEWLDKDRKDGNDD